MISLIIILEVIFLSISGIYYMSLMAYKGQDQFHKKKVVLAVVMFGCSMPGVLTCVTGDLQEKEWETGFFYLFSYTSGDSGCMAALSVERKITQSSFMGRRKGIHP